MGPPPPPSPPIPLPSGVPPPPSPPSLSLSFSLSYRCIVDRFTALARDLISIVVAFALWKPPPSSSPEACGERCEDTTAWETAEINTPEEGGSARIKLVFMSCQIQKPLAFSVLSGARRVHRFSRSFRKIENFQPHTSLFLSFASGLLTFWCH